jgi:rubrerythrin
MGIKFNANEIFHIAEKIEENGSAFYRKAAGFSSNPSVKDALTSLADMEDEHKATFAVMRAELRDDEKKSVAYDPDQEVIDYLDAMANGGVFDVRSNPSLSLKGNENPVEVLKRAIGLEKDSIVFYLGIRDLVPEKRGRDRVDDIIRQEMSHITILNREIRKLK